MRTIQAKYYDGQSSQAHTVEVQLNTENIHISGFDERSLLKIQHTWLVEMLEDVDFSSSDTVQLQYGKFPYQSLVFSNKEDVQFFRESYPEVSNKNLYRNVLSGNIYKVLGISLTLLVLVVSFYLFVVAPFIAEKAVALVPPSAEIKLGEKMTEPLFKSMSFDDEKSDLLVDFYEEIGLESSYPLKLYVEESSTVNAFAVPGGKIVVYQGILDEMENWQELAGLLGHELAHVEKQHSLKGMARNLSTYLVFSILTGDASGVSAVFLENTLKLKDLANSRSAEREADEVGMEYLLENDIDPIGMIQLFETLQKASGMEDLEESKGKKLLKMMSTHPLTSERIDYLTKAVDQYKDRDFPEKERAKELFELLKG